MDEQNSRSFERIEADTVEDDFRGSSEAQNRFQQRTYRVPQHEGFMEQALPSQYHATMKVATSIPPTSLRGIQHMSQKTEQASKLIFSYSTFKLESDNFDDDLDLPITEQALADHLETLETDIFEMEEIKHCNLGKIITDSVNGSRKSLLYSREIPTKSMEIQAIPFNREKSQCDQVNWHRFFVYQLQENLHIVIEGTDPHFLYECVLTSETYLNLQKLQSIQTCFSDFAKRLSTLLDYCILQLHTSSEVKSRFTCILNEGEKDPEVQTMYICEQNEFRKLVHLQLQFGRMSEVARAEFHQAKSEIQAKMGQIWLKQKMILIQKSRDGCQAMLEINESLKMLKDENQRVLEEVRGKHFSEKEEAEALKQEEISQINSRHSFELSELTQTHKRELDPLKLQNSQLLQQLTQSQQSFEKEQIKNQHQSESITGLQSQVEQYLSEIKDFRIKLENQNQNVTALEKDKIHLTIDNDRKDSLIESQEASVKDLKEKLNQDSAELYQLKIEHTKLGQQSINQLDSIEQLNAEVKQITETLEKQAEETAKYKEKKGQFKESFKSSEDEGTRLNVKIKELEKSVIELESLTQEKEGKFSEKVVVIEALQNKLKETQVTLMSNNSTIDELKNSLAEAQKYSFRAILNNRSSAHHPPAPPVGYQGQFQGQQTSLSQYLKTNDNRQSSNSRSPMKPVAEHVTSTISQNLPQTIHSKTQVVSAQKSETEPQYITSQRVAMPLTEYYANKFSTGTGGGLPRPVRNFAEPALQNLENENSFMVQAQAQMLKRQESNQFARQLERDQLASSERLNFPVSKFQQMSRDESKQSAMFGNQRSSAAVSEHYVVDDQKIEREFEDQI